MKSRKLLRAITLLVLLVSFVPAHSAGALAPEIVPPVDMFQLPWDLGLAWVSLDVFDNGTKRLLNSPHNYLNGGAVDFAPRKDMKLGEDTSNFWVTAAAAGTVTEISSCHLKINHGNGWITEYQFLANIRVRLGEAVSRNQRIAVIADGVRQQFCPPALEPDIPHLHFSLRPNMRNATFAGWQFTYNPLFNRMTFIKGSQTAGQYEPLLNVFDTAQVVLRDPITWDIVYVGSVDAFRYERWPFTLTETTSFTITATPTTSGLTPMLVLLDANGNEITRTTGPLTSTQSAGNYFIQIQPQTGSGFYNLLLHKNNVPVPTGPYTSTVIVPTTLNVGQSAVVTVSLNNVPAEGYASAEFTCTYNPGLIEVSNIVFKGLFGPDPAMAISGPQNGSFIAAIAGSFGNKATTGGEALTFNVKGLQAGQSTIDCKARVSTGNNTLTEISSVAASLTVLQSTPTSTPVPPSTPVDTSTPGPSPTPTLTSTPGPSPTATSTATAGPSPTPTSTVMPIPGDWLTFTNSTYQFQFRYPKEAQIDSGGTNNFARINLPRAPGTNLGHKYLEVTVVENAAICQSSLATRSMLETSETVTINDISFLKQTGQDGTAGHINKWTAYSTSRENVCVSLDFIMRIADPGAFATPPAPVDEAAESAVFGQIVSTYTWLGSGSLTPTATFTSTPQPTTGTLTGQVHASKPVTINLYKADSSLAGSTTASSDGTFSLTAPAGTYTVVASASGFLSAQGPATLTAGATTIKPTVSLPAGDIDGNNVIDQFDAMTIGMSYNTALPTAADLNSDGIINVLDLELLADNYRKSGALAWQ